MFAENRRRARTAWAVAGFLVLLPLSASASVMHLVDSMDALYFTNWGHPYTEIYDGTNNAAAGLGRGAPAEVVSNFGSPTDFAAFAEVEIEASGSNAINKRSPSDRTVFRALSSGRSPSTRSSVCGANPRAPSSPIGASFFIGDSATPRRPFRSIGVSLARFQRRDLHGQSRSGPERWFGLFRHPHESAGTLDARAFRAALGLLRISSRRQQG